MFQLAYFVMAVEIEKKTIMMPLPDSQKSVMICPFVLTQYWHWTDRRTDRHTNRQTELVKQYHALHTLHADMR